MSRVGRPLREASRTATTATSSTEAPISRISLRWWTVRGPVLSTSLPYLIFYPPLTICGSGRVTRTPRPRATGRAPMVALAHERLITLVHPAPRRTAMPARKKSRRVRLIVIAVVLLLVAGIGFGSYWGVSTVRASFPQTTGSLKLKGLSGACRRQARRQRHPADLRRHPRRPLPRPGLRPGAGPLLRDGRAPPPHLRPAVGDVRQEPGRDRRLPAHPRLARRRAEGVRHPARRHHQERTCRPTPTASTPI